MKLTSLWQLVNKLQQAGKIDNLQQVCDIFGRVDANDFTLAPRRKFLWRD